MKKLYLLVYLFILLTGIGANAQDVQFSQFYANPIFLNPAFAGGAHAPRGILHNRLQWPGINNDFTNVNAKYSTMFGSFDGFSDKYRSGYGVYFMQDYQGTNTINQSELQLQYAYELSISKHATFRAGFQFGVLSKSIDFSDLTSPSQFNNRGYMEGSVNEYGQGRVRSNMLDAGSGGLFYSRNFWIGFAANHINTPNNSFLNDNSKWPAKFSFVTGYKIPLIHNKHMAYLEDEKDISITPTVHYKFQGKSDQLDVGLYGTYDQLIAGMWYRGIPFKKYAKKLHNHESIVLLGGWRYKNYTVGYSYDFVVSKLKGAKTLGAHELVLTYTHHKHQKKHKPMRRIPCPTIDKSSTYR